MDKQIESLGDHILSFWFGRPDAEGGYSSREAWWQKDPAFDAEICSRYLSPYGRAVTGELDAMAQTAEGALSLILLLDQFPRNMFRGNPACYASDEQARTIATQALDAGFDQTMPAVWRWFIYMPFEHSEHLADQALSVSLFESLPEMPGWDETVAAAHRHREIVARFGRFPHRNIILGRHSTPEELEFLKQPDSSF